MKRLTKALTALIGSVAVVGALAAPGWAQEGSARSHSTTASEVGKVLVDAPASRAAFAPGSGQLVVDWNKELIKIEQTPGAQPATIQPTRSYALLQTAIYDAVVSITHADAPYAFSIVAPRDARSDAAADQAAHDILSSLFPSFGTQLDQMLATELANVPNGPGKDAGITVGQRAATLLLALRANDGSAATPLPFNFVNQPGAYQKTPPNDLNPVFTNWGSVTPWVLNTGDQFRPPPPPALTSPEWATAINQVQSLGENTSTTRTPDETTIAKFWAPPIWNTWNEIADGQVISHQSNLENAAHVMETLNQTLADSAIGFYDAKYTYNLWRPVTAIEAGTPNNPAVDPANPTWLPQPTTTAADPSYPAAHSTVSEAAATILSAFYGDHVDLTVASDALPGVTRSFSSFQAAADEAGFSRIVAGQHTSIDVNAGDVLGKNIAQFVLGQPFGTEG
jgi:membrane-associated phospholipid phosphatase